MSDQTFHHVLAVPVSGDDHAQGSATATVTLVMYGDYQCPFTASLHLVITKLQRRFGAQLRYVFRHFPLFARHPQAQLAAEAAEAAAAQGKFWDMHACLFQKQYDFNRDSLAPACDLLGLDYLRLDRDISGHTHLAKIQAQVAGTRQSGVAGTPALFINGRSYDASEDFETLSKTVETLLPANDAGHAKAPSFLRRILNA